MIILDESKPVRIEIPHKNIVLEGDLSIPQNASGIVLFAHGSGSGRFSPRNQAVAQIIREAGIGTLLFDLLSRHEEAEDFYTAKFRFDIEFLSKRLVHATRWILNRPDISYFKIGYFGASTGAAAALSAAAELPHSISAIVSRGGRPDLARDSLSLVTAPTLLIVGERDDEVIRLNEGAFSQLRCKKEFRIIPDATHLFEEPGALEQVARFAAEWFQEKLKFSQNEFVKKENRR